MKRAVAFAYVLGLFLLGGVIGALGMHLYYAAQIPPVAEHREVGPEGEPPPPPGPLQTWGRLLRTRDRLAYLELSEAQQREVRRIRREAQRRMGGMRDELRPRMEAELGRLRDELRDVLEPQQFERLEQELQRPRARPRRGRRPGARPSGHAP